MKTSPPRKGWRRLLSSKLVLLALACLVLVVLAIGSFAVYHNVTLQQSVVDDAAQCGKIHFPPSATVVLATTDADWHGDGHIKVVADLPTRDLDDFEKKSELPPLIPGQLDDWIKSKEKVKELADVLRTGKPEDFLQVYQDARESPSGRSRDIVAQRIDDEKTRVYISLTCF